MKRSGELHHVFHPWRLRIIWAIFYLVVATGLIVGLYMVASHIRTHSLAVGKLQLSTPYSKYVVGEEISFKLTNGYNSAIYFTNQCPTEPLAVYRQDNGRWVRQHEDPINENCPVEDRQIKIPASSEVTVSLKPWQSLFSKTGTYRLVAVVDNYASLPYTDFQIIDRPTIAVAQTSSNQTISQPTKSNTTSSTVVNTSSTNSPASSVSTTPTGNPAPTPNPTPTVAPKTYTINVNSSGNYDITSLTLRAGDSIKIVYTKPYGNEVRTRFTAIPPTTTVVNSLTVDSEFTSGSRQFPTAGSWKFKADDHSGNSGIITVN